MKRISIYIFLTAMIAVFGSCNKWLDIMPEDTTTEKQLFSDAGGYHAAINGLYQTMASSSLYGENLTWGFTSALSQYYDNASVSNSKNFSYTEKYEYNSDEMKTYGLQIWETAYNVIANANNILAHLETAKPEMFPEYDKCEVDVIKGEALAVRALMHFELLRLFAEAPAVNANAKAIPYVQKHPSIFNERKTVKEVVGLVQEDLSAAADLLAKNDTTDIGYINMYMTSNRFMTTNANRNYFFTGRGVRLNYVGVMSILARAKAYAGDMEGAYEIAKFLTDTYVDREGWYRYMESFSATDTEASRPHKLMEELLVCFYTENLAVNYASLTNKRLSDNSYALKNVDGIFTDNSDIRRTKLISNYDLDTQISLKYGERSGSSNLISVENRVLPVMRLSELYLIMAEYLATNGQVPAAVDILNELRNARGCMNNIDSGISEPEFMAALNTEVLRENVAEGQYFFYCKRRNEPTINNGGVFVQMQNKYTMTIPDSEVSLN